MFERMTDRARRTIVLAQQESKELKHYYIGSEHLLLGLIHEAEGIAGMVLLRSGVSLDGVRAILRDQNPGVESGPPPHIPFTVRAKRVLDLSLREALALGHNYINTEHLLLGLLREGEGVAANVLTESYRLQLSALRSSVLDLLKQVMEPAGSDSPRDDDDPEMEVVSFGLLADNLTTITITIDDPNGVAEITGAVVVYRDYNGEEQHAKWPSD